jgi:hypothetical protein
MKASDSSAGGAAGQFRSPRRAVVMVFADVPSQPVSLAFCEALVAAEGVLRP